MACEKFISRTCFVENSGSLPSASREGPFPDRHQQTLECLLQLARSNLCAVCPSRDHLNPGSLDSG